MRGEGRGCTNSEPDIKANRGKTENVIGLLPTNSGSILKRTVKRDRSVADQF